MPTPYVRPLVLAVDLARRSHSTLRSVGGRPDFLQQSESDSSAVPEFSHDLDYEYLALCEHPIRSACGNRVRVERRSNGPG